MFRLLRNRVVELYLWVKIWARVTSAREKEKPASREREEALEPTEERCIEISEMMLKKNKGKQA
jgi:hypothetical protein